MIMIKNKSKIIGRSEPEYHLQLQENRFMYKPVKQNVLN